MPGEHNRLNAAVAAAVARVLSVEEPLLREALESFVGVPGRLELVREVGGIKMYNDTTSTVPDATVAALGAIGNADKKNVVLIMGGSDKGLDMQPVVAAAQRYAKAVFLLDGTGTNRIKNEFPAAPVYTSMEEAVRAAYERCGTGDALLLSPAFASFGMFQNEYERGDQFDAAVKNLR
jgi:UDP-N-acetylmuramoylalanine--D-glutamate ligase